MRDRIAERHTQIADQFARDISARSYRVGEEERTIGAHELTILHDVGLYRHLRCKSPDTREYWFDVVTWPGSLTIRGDITDAYTFSRERDMFGFFRSKHDRINPDYWAEKLDAGRRSAKQYSEEVFQQSVWSAVRQKATEYPGLAKAVQDEFFGLYVCIGTTTEAHQALEGFSYVPPSRRGFQQPFQFTDSWEWDLTDWDAGFLRACHGIVWAIRAYDETKAAVPALAGVS